MKKKSDKIFIKNFGCSRRALDTTRIHDYILANNQKITNKPEEAKYIIITSCGLEFAEKQALKMIKEFKKFDGEIILCGCLPETNPEELNKQFDGKRISTKNLEEIDKFFPDFRIKFSEISDANRGYDQNPHKTISIRNMKAQIKNKVDIDPLGKSFLKTQKQIENYREKLGVKNRIPGEKILQKWGEEIDWVDVDEDYFSIRISEGCLGNCSYCAIKNAIGRLKSKPKKTIIQEVKKALSKGRYKLNIQSSDTGSYGLDIGTNLPSLLKNILKQDDRILFEFIQDLHPNWICMYKEDFLELSKARKINSVLVAFQSGSERILKLMNRHQSMEEFLDILKEMKKLNPRLKIRTQVIVGFPSETEVDFQKTLEIIKQGIFDKVDIFPYHETKRMDSLRIKPKVSQKTKMDRMKRLQKIVSTYHSQPGWK